jgi:hypothetical protein
MGGGPGSWSWGEGYVTAVRQPLSLRVSANVSETLRGTNAAAAQAPSESSTGTGTGAPATSPTRLHKNHPTPCGKHAAACTPAPLRSLMRRSKHVLNAQVSIRSPCCGSADVLGENEGSYGQAKNGSTAQSAMLRRPTTPSRRRST